MVAKGTPDVSVVIVSYNVCELLDQCLSSVFAAKERLRIEVIVVDNASKDDTVTRVRQKYPQVCLIANESNRGFAAACNQALMRGNGRYLMLLNPDTVVQHQALGSLVRFLDAHPDVAAVGPRLLNPDQTLQSSCRSFPNLWLHLFQALLLNRLIPKMDQVPNWLVEHWNHTRLREVDYVLGAALAVRRDVVRQVGLLDEHYFLYGEEKDWCYRMAECGHSTWYFPGAEVLHYGGQSTSQNRLRSLTHLYQGQLRFLNKHYDTVQACVLYGLLILGAFSRLTAHTLRNLVLFVKYEPEWSRSLTYARLLAWLLRNGGQLVKRAPAEELQHLRNEPP